MSDQPTVPCVNCGGMGRFMQRHGTEKRYTIEMGGCAWCRSSGVRTVPRADPDVLWALLRAWGWDDPPQDRRCFTAGDSLYHYERDHGVYALVPEMVELVLLRRAANLAYYATRPECASWYINRGHASLQRAADEADARLRALCRRDRPPWEDDREPMRAWLWEQPA